MALNQLSGELADFADCCPNLQVLDLSSQKKDDNAGFTGVIPDVLSNLSFLSKLTLAGNELAGSIPPVLGNLAQLKELDLSDNYLSGSIPAALGGLGGKSCVTVCLWFHSM